MVPGSIKPIIEKYKYPILILAIGMFLLLIPGKNATEIENKSSDMLLQQVLSSSKGIGNVRLISSERGVVISCEGAEDPQVRLDIIRAVSAYTGFGSDKITILKMVKQ